VKTATETQRSLSMGSPLPPRGAGGIPYLAPSVVSVAVALGGSADGRG
jgi:hypothetical protein